MQDLSCRDKAKPAWQPRLTILCFGHFVIYVSVCRAIAPIMCNLCLHLVSVIFSPSLDIKLDLKTPIQGELAGG